MLTCGVVLSGGQSTRMGTNKSLLPIDGKVAIAHIVDELTKCVNDIIVIANEKQPYKFLKQPIYADRFQDKGPLAGLESALYHHDADLYYMAACDMPFVSCQVYNVLSKQAEDFDAIIPIYEGREHPLAGIYRRSILPHVQNNINNDRLRMNSFHHDIKVKYVDTFPSVDDQTIQRHFFNMNNPKQYEAAKRL